MIFKEENKKLVIKTSDIGHKTTCEFKTPIDPETLHAQTCLHIIEQKLYRIINLSSYLYWEVKYVIKIFINSILSLINVYLLSISKYKKVNKRI